MRFTLSSALLASSAYARITRVPEWLPAETKEAFAKALSSFSIFDEIYGVGDGYQILRSENEKHDMFKGSLKRYEVLFPEFKSVWLAILPEESACVEQLDFWVYRPEWFIPRKDEIKAARGCIKKLFEALPQDVETESDITRDGSAMIDVLNSVIPVMFGSEAQFIIETENSSATFARVSELGGVTGFKGLKGFVHSLPQLEALITATPAAETLTTLKEVIAAETADGRFLQRILDSQFTHPMMIHLPAFADSYRDLDLWKLALTSSKFDFDALD